MKNGVCKVTILQGDENIVRFEFKSSSDALAFVETCLECGEPNTEVYIKIEGE